MDRYTHPFDRDLADHAGLPEYINKDTYPEIRVLDRVAFIKGQGFEPSIGSIFMITNGGSVSTGDWRYDTINGTLCTAPGWENYERLFQAKKTERTNPTSQSPLPASAQ